MGKISRRQFFKGTTGSLIAAAVAPPLSAQEPQPVGAGAPDPPFRPVPLSTIVLTVNGVRRELQVEDRATLAEVLRDTLELTGTKVGCDRGECGACTVVVDGKPIYACSRLAVWLDGGSIQTVDGLAQDGRLDPLQESFIRHDAPQCGFCTSGQLMAARALLDRNPAPTRDEVRAAMSGNLCRCSNYNNYVEAVLGAGIRGAGASVDTASMGTVGRPLFRVDAMHRVAGTATYTADIRLPGMLDARVLGSPHPHARIRRIDVSRAMALPGVRAILTRDNCDLVWTSGDRRNTRYLFNNPVRFAGEPVAVVAAVDRHIAEEAMLLIEVEYEPLPFVLDAEEALEGGAPEIQPGGNLSPTGPGVASMSMAALAEVQSSLSPNAAGLHEPEIYRRGNVGAGLSDADVVIEDRYTSVHNSVAQLELPVAIAEWNGGKLTMYAATAGVATYRNDLARCLNEAPENIRVISLYMGGAFGQRSQCQDYDLMAAALAREAGAPVKLELTRKQDFIATHGRWPTAQYYTIGAKRDGTLTAIRLRGYGGLGPYRKAHGDVAGLDAYQCPNVEQITCPVYTNIAVSGNFRAPAHPQGVFGIESVMDDVAHALGMDPLEFRLKNMTRRFMDRVPYTSNGLEACIRRGAEAFGWAARWRPAGSQSGPVRRGVGMGMGTFPAPLGRSSAMIRLDARGTYYLHVGVTDCGTGAKTAMAMIAAEELGVPLERIVVIWGDTERCPPSVGESGGRTTVFTGTAVIEAARELKRRIAEEGMPQGNTILSASATPQPAVEGATRFSFVAHFAAVEVDMETGHVRVTEFLSAHDSGRIISPLTAASQVRGGTLQGIGMALHEELRYDRRTGLPLTGSYYYSRIITHMDAPEVEVLFVEPEDPYAPYGAKTLGEPPLVPPVAAVANALFNSTGRRIKSLPITRDKVLEVLA